MIAEDSSRDGEDRGGVGWIAGFRYREHVIDRARDLLLGPRTLLTPLPSHYLDRVTLNYRCFGFRDPSRDSISYFLVLYDPIDDFTDRIDLTVDMTDQATFLSTVASADEYVHLFEARYSTKTDRNTVSLTVRQQTHITSSTCQTMTSLMATCYQEPSRKCHGRPISKSSTVILAKS